MADPTGWVTIALYLADGIALDDAASLKALVSAADMVDHAVISLDEVTHGLADLSARGCLDVVGTSCRLSDEARVLVAASIEETGFPSPRSVATQLTAHPCFMAPAVPSIESATFARAVELHLARLNALLRDA